MDQAIGAVAGKQFVQDIIKVDDQHVARLSRQFHFDQALGRAAHDAHIVDQPAIGLGLNNGIDGAGAQQNQQQEKGLKAEFQHVPHSVLSPAHKFLRYYAIPGHLLRKEFHHADNIASW